MLTVKAIRNAFDNALAKCYHPFDYTVQSTKTMDSDHSFRISFTIIKNEFWLDYCPTLGSISIYTRDMSNDVCKLDTIRMWVKGPVSVDNSNFDFGWRIDLKEFFDLLYDKLLTEAKNAGITNCPAKDDAPVKIGPFKEDQLMKYLEEEEAASYEEYVAKVDEAKIGEAKIAEPSIFNSLKDDEDDDEDEYI